MPIVSRSLTKLANREDIGPGIKRWRAEAVDSKGRRWVHGPFSATQVDAAVIRDGAMFDTAEQDRQELTAHIEAKKPIAAFDFAGSEITRGQGEGFLLRRFARERGDTALAVAWWIDGLSQARFDTIRGRLGYSVTKGARIRARAAKLAAAEPALDEAEAT